MTRRFAAVTIERTFTLEYAGGYPVKIVGVRETNLEECVQQSQRERVVLTSRGKPVAVLLGVRGMDLEQIERGSSDELWTLIRNRRRQRTISRAELDKRLAQPRRT
ncbi:MAG: hypothetical protein U0746_17825 [Gemmataceae bacterium]